MEKEILDALKIKLKNLGFGEKAFEGVAKYLATTVTEQGQIETAITGVEPLLKSFQGDVDKRVNDAVAKAKADAGKSDPTKKKEGEDDEPKDDPTMPAWAKQLIEQNKVYADKLTALESGKTLETRKSQLEAKLKDAPEKVKTSYMKQFERMSFKDDEDFTGYLADVETQATELAQEISNSGLKGFGKPKQGQGKGGTVEPPKEEVKAIVGDLMKN